MEGNLKGKEGNTTESQKLKNKRKKEKKRKGISESMLVGCTVGL